MPAYRALTPQEIERLAATGCTAQSWADVRITDATDIERVRHVAFSGKVSLEAVGGESIDGPSEIRNASLHNVSLAANVRVVNVHGILSNYQVGERASIINVGRCETTPGATFGNGVEVETLNEGGGRVVRLYDGLSTQVAYLMTRHRWRPKLIAALNSLIDRWVDSVRADQGTIGACAVVENVGEMRNVRVGPHAVVRGANRLTDGTILSEEAAPAFVGSGVFADHFIIAEGASVDTAAVLDKVYVGQGTKLGKTFSAENSLFFANCEGFHSEAVAVFAGPYTVTHHRASLLIAGLFSFYNAGSATNQSNHMYKLGPVHQGIIERGSKTASGSYMLWPSVVGPFCVVMGKNMANFDSSPFPFSYITAEAEGTTLTPAMNMFTVGTMRDGDKWPKRDRRKATNKRDLIRFEVMSPFVVERMIEGEKILAELADTTDKSQKTVRVNGLVIRRLLLRKGAKDYTAGIDRYLLGEILKRVDHNAGNGNTPPAQAMAIDPDAMSSRAWCDIGGMLINRERLNSVLEKIERGQVRDLNEVQRLLHEADAAYDKDAWAWVRTTYQQRSEANLDSLDPESIAQMRQTHRKLESSLTKNVLADGEKDFDLEARLGYGADGDESARNADFEAVRGSAQTNSFIVGLKKRLGEED